MLSKAAQYLVILWLATPLLATEASSAEIYKWVDDKGNVHFGDKPMDPAQAADAKPVELNTGYQPPARTAEEQEALESELRSLQQKAGEHQRTQQQAQEEANANSRLELAELCAAYESNIKKLTTIELVDGRRQIYYMKSEDGKPVTARRQREIIEEARAEMVAAGCS